MPSWIEIGEEMRNNSIVGLRRKYLGELSKHTGRNIIVFYSGWLHNPSARGTDINDTDINALMTCIHKMDCKKGLDLILHTPGGEVSATEQIVNYLHQKFNRNIRAFVPQIAMSAGTMIACACQSIYMGKQSCLGPIDPQYGGISAKGVIEEFKKAVSECTRNPGAIPIWQAIISKYHPTMIASCQKAWDRSQKMVATWLEQNMFSDPSTTSKSKAAKVVKGLVGTGHKLGHDKHISINEAMDIGLNIKFLENDQKLQDLVLTIHHCTMQCMANDPKILKIIENQMGAGLLVSMG